MAAGCEAYPQSLSLGGPQRAAEGRRMCKAPDPVFKSRMLQEDCPLIRALVQTLTLLATKLHPLPLQISFAGLLQEGAGGPGEPSVALFRCLIPFE